MSSLIIDADSHVTEPHDLWTGRMSKARWGDNVPRIVRHGDGTDYWHVADEPVVVAISSAFVKQPDNKAPSRWMPQLAFAGEKTFLSILV